MYPTSYPTLPSGFQSLDRQLALSGTVSQCVYHQPMLHGNVTPMWRNLTVLSSPYFHTETVLLYHFSIPEQSRLHAQEFITVKKPVHAPEVAISYMVHTPVLY